MKHLALDYHFVRENVQSGLLQVQHISSLDQLADLLTKPLSRTRFTLLRDKLCRIINLRGRMEQHQLKPSLQEEVQRIPPLLLESCPQLQWQNHLPDMVCEGEGFAHKPLRKVWFVWRSDKWYCTTTLQEVS